MIILIGESASGKSSVEKVLAKKYHYDKTVSYTTRPKRKGETDGVDYHFVSMDEFTEKFNDGFFVEVGNYNHWFYGTTRDQYTEHTVCVLTPHGFRQIKKNIKDLDIVSFYIKVPRRDRMIKALKRGDDVDEAIRRNQSDVGQYDGIVDEVDYVLRNDGYISDPENLADEIIDLLNKRGDRV